MATVHDAHALGSSQPLLSIGEAAKRYRIHENTLRRYADSGALAVLSLPSGHRRFRQIDLEKFLGAVQENGDGAGNPMPVALLARVSSNKQKIGYDKDSGCGREGKESDLTRQVERLRNYARENFGVEGTLYADVGSGLSFTRKNFLRMIDAILEGKYRNGVVLATYKDRLARWGHELLERIAQAGGCRIQFIEVDPEKTEQQELVEDLIALTTIFAARLHGKRSAETNRAVLEPATIQEAKRLCDSGIPISDACKRLTAEGHRTHKGRPITVYVLSRVLKETKLLESVLPSSEAKHSFELWAEAHLVKAEAKARLRKTVIYRAYQADCRLKKITPVSPMVAGAWLRSRFTKKLDRKNFCMYLGVALKSR